MGLPGSPNNFHSLLEEWLTGLTWKFTISYFYLASFFWTDNPRTPRVPPRSFQSFRDGSIKISLTECFFLQLESAFPRKSCELWVLWSRSWAIATNNKYVVPKIATVIENPESSIPTTDYMLIVLQKLAAPCIKWRRHKGLLPEFLRLRSIWSCEGEA